MKTLLKYTLICSTASLLFSCSKTIPTSPNISSTYLALGDSYTIGESVQPEERFPNQVVAKLAKKGIELSEPMIIAKTGWTTTELKAAMNDAKILDKRFDYVSLLIGVNNQYRGLSITDYEQEFSNLLKDAITLASGKVKNVFVVSIPDWGVTPFGLKSTKPEISKRIDQFNEVNARITKQMKVTYINITPESRNAKSDISLVANDGLHPSGKMYEQWAEAIINGFKFK